MPTTFLRIIDMKKPGLWGSMILRPSPSIVLNLGGKWEEGEGILFQGHIFEDDALKDGGIFHKPWDVGDLDGMLSHLRAAQGFFSCILFDKDRLLLIVDHIRSYPLYYRVSGKDIIVTDDPRLILDPVRDSLSIPSALEFLCVGYVTGDGTLMEGIKQVRPGTCVLFHDGQLEKRTYFDYRTDLKQSIGLDDYHSAFMDALRASFQRLQAVTRGDPVAVALSGGFDSRLIALCLKKFDFKNVIAFSYGKPCSKDPEISKQVAKELGFDWFFVPYSNELWGKVARSKTWSDCCSYAFKLSGIPHLQDFPAVESLLREGVINERTTITPGHRAPGVRVSKFIPDKDDMVSKDDIINEILSFHYNLWRFDRGSPLDKMFRAKLSETLDVDRMVPKNVAASINGNWYWRERESKFLANSVRCYEVQGLKWWLPLLDKGLMTFFEKAVFDCRELACFDRSVRKLMEELVGDAEKFGRARWRDTHPPSPMKRGEAKGESGAAKGGGSPPFEPSMDWVRNREFTNKLLYQLGYNRETEHQDSDYFFYGLVDKRQFLRTYTGKESINSFISLDLVKGYLDPRKLSPSDKELLRSIHTFKSNMLSYLRSGYRRKGIVR